MSPTETFTEPRSETTTWRTTPTGSINVARRIPDAKLGICPESRHGGVFQHHDLFVPDVHEFLEA